MTPQGPSQTPRWSPKTSKWTPMFPKVTQKASTVCPKASKVTPRAPKVSSKSPQGRTITQKTTRTLPELNDFSDPLFRNRVPKRCSKSAQPSASSLQPAASSLQPPEWGPAAGGAALKDKTSDNKRKCKKLE